MGVLERDQNPHKKHTRDQVSSSRAVMGTAYFPFCYYYYFFENRPFCY